ncbi:hypothetical protein M513_12811, partial [Trichuris suis]
LVKCFCKALKAQPFTAVVKQRRNGPYQPFTNLSTYLLHWFNMNAIKGMKDKDDGDPLTVVKKHDWQGYSSMDIKLTEHRHDLCKRGSEPWSYLKDEGEKMQDRRLARDNQWHN